jgi:hypothetical protein
MLNHRFALLTLAGLLTVQPALVAAASPAEPIIAIYKKAAAGKGEDGGNFVYQERRDRARWLSKSLAALWNAEEARTPKGDETPPGFDPVSNSQDPKVRNVKVVLEKRDGKRATVAASFDSWPRGRTVEEQERNPPDPRDRITVRYDMVLEHGPKNAIWKIDDIRGTIDGKAWSIRAIVNHFNGD